MDKKAAARFKWQQKDIIMAGILGLLFAVIYIGVLNAGLALQVALTPAGLAPFGFEVVYGIWFMAATLAAYIIQKPGVAVVTEFLAALIEFFMGNMGGPMVLVSGLVQGLGSEAGFAAFGYKKYNWASMCASAILAAGFSFAWGAVANALGVVRIGMLAAMLSVRIVSAVAFSGILCKLAGDALARTGVLKSYSLGMKAGVTGIADDGADADAA